MDGHVIGQARHRRLIAMASSDLERDDGNLPWSPRRPKRSVETSDLEYEHRAGSELHGSIDRNARDQTAVHEVLPVHLYGLQQSRHRAAGEHRIHDWTVGEPMLSGP